MKKLLLATLFLLGFSVLAVAQDVPRAEIFGGYSYFRADNQGSDNSINLNGWNASVAFNGNKNLAFLADFGGVYGTEEGVDIKLHTIMFGPRVSVPVGRVTPFVQGLLGYARLTGDSSDVQVLRENDFAMAFGGGVDINVTNRIAVRPVQIEYMGVKMASDGKFSNNLRYSAGLIFKLGKF